jgi:hypothetical protein
MSAVYIVVTRGNQASVHTKGSAIPKGFEPYPGFETLSFSDAVAKARKVGKPIRRTFRPRNTNSES